LKNPEAENRIPVKKVAEGGTLEWGETNAWILGMARGMTCSKQKRGYDIKPGS